MLINPGWNQRIESSILLQQLDGYLSEEQYRKANAVLFRLRPEDCSALTSKSWILGRSGAYLPPAKVFSPGYQLISRPLAPYLDAVDGEFAKDHDKLLAPSKLKPEPSIGDLRAVQINLLETAEEPLSPSSLQIAITVLEIATRLKYDSTDLLVPDTTSRLQMPADIVHGEPFGIGDKSGFKFTHSEISSDLANRLGLETPSERAIRLDIDLESDDDEEDFTPSESLETVVGDHQLTAFSSMPILRHNLDHSLLILPKLPQRERC